MNFHLEVSLAVEFRLLKLLMQKMERWHYLYFMIHCSVFFCLLFAILYIGQLSIVGVLFRCMFCVCPFSDKEAACLLAYLSVAGYAQ